MSHPAVTCEIVAIGNELLIGDVADTNTHWLIAQLTGLGGFVRRCVLIRDEFPAIADALHAGVDARSDLIVTSGGLGPTGDDLTLAAVAAAFNRPLVAHEEAMAMLTRRYSELAAIGWVKSAEMNEARRKMAMFPQGATPLYNPVGGAPAASLRVDGTTIVCLPGVPAELKGIFVQTMSPLLKELFGTATYAIRTVIVNCQDESQMAGELQGVVERHPRIYIKSRARRFGPDISIRVSLSTTGTDAASVASALDAAESDLAHSMARLGLTSTRAEE